MTLCTSVSRHSSKKKLLDEMMAAKTVWEEWRNASIDLGCRLDSAILALAQHYGVPSHGLESPQATMLHCGLPQIDIGGT
jgi:hypothetical protein